MTDPEFGNLVDLILNYFESSSGEAARAGDSFERAGGDPLLLEFTGVVGVSGQRNGCIYFTSPAALLEELAANLLGIDAATRDAARDMVGEIANMIGGNAQQYLSGDFVISAPIMLEGRPKNIRLPIYDHARVIPVDWKSHRTYAVFGLRS